MIQSISLNPATPPKLNSATLRAHGDQIAEAVVAGLTQYLSRRNSTTGQLFTPTLRGSHILLPFQYVVLDDQRLYHYHRFQLVGEGALNSITSRIRQTVALTARAYGFMPDDCEELRERLEREGVHLPFGVTYIVPLVALPRLLQQNAPARPTLPTQVELDLEKITWDKLQVPIGVSANGPVMLNLAKTTHALFVGETQSGKTSGIHAALYGLTKLNAPSAFRFVMASPKANESAFWNGSPHLWRATVADHAGLLDLLEQLNAEIELRARLLAQPGKLCSTLGEWHAICTPEERLPHLLVIIDETLDFLTAGKMGRDIANRLQPIITKGLAYGVVVWLLTQHVRDDSGRGIPRIIESQLRTRFIWRVADQYAAEQAGCPGAEDIPASIPGRLVARIHERRELVQGYWVNKELLRAQADLFAQAEAGVLSQTALAQLSDAELGMLIWSAQENDDFLSLADIQGRGLGQQEAKRLAERLERDGWLYRDRNSRNKRRLTGPALDLVRVRLNKSGLE